MSNAEPYAWLSPIGSSSAMRSARENRPGIFPSASDAVGITVGMQWTMLVCSTVALITSCYLAWASLTSSSVAGCGGGNFFDCDHVLHSRWSTVLSIPVSLPAMATHALILTLLLVKPTTQKWSQARWAAIGFASLSAGLAALWFVGLQLFWLQHLCPYCLVAHAGGITLAGIFLGSRPVELPALRWIACGAVASVGGLIAIQSFAASPQTYEVIHHADNAMPSNIPVIMEPAVFEAPDIKKDSAAMLLQGQIERGYVQSVSMIAAIVNPIASLYSEVDAVAKQKPPRTARVLNGLELDSTAWPLLGNPDAELVFVELFDYTCPHCQRTHVALEAARTKFGDRLAVITLAVPLNKQCNPAATSTQAAHSEACELAKLAIAVWIVDHQQFEPFHDYLFATKPKYAQASAHARTIVDEAKLKATLLSNVPSEFISKHVALYQKAGAGTIPKLMFPSTTTVGAVESSEAMVRLIEQNLRN